MKTSNLAKRVVSFAIVLIMALGLVPAEVLAEPAVNFGRWPDVPSLHEHFSNYFLIGNIWHSSWQTPGGANRSMDTETQAFFMHHFNALTAEDYHKPDQMITNTSPGNLMNLPRADQIVNFANDNNIAMVGHTLIWHSQSRLWMTGRTGYAIFPLVTRQQAIANMEQSINLVAGHYARRIHSWDVVNEVFRSSIVTAPSQDTLNSNPNWWRTQLRNETIGLGVSHLAWYNAFANGATESECGSDFIYYAFRFARLADPNAILYYNDYNEEQPGKRAAIHQMVTQLNARWLTDPANTSPNRPLIEVIGMQSHYHLDAWGGMNWGNIRAALELFTSIPGVTVSITELDITVGPESNFNPNPGLYVTRAPLSAEDQARQAVAFGRLFRYYVEFNHSINRVSFWGIADNRGWRRGGHPSLFDTNYQPKKAFWAVLAEGTPFQAAPVLTLTLSTVQINNNNLTATSTVGGTAVNAITLTHTLPAGITVTESGGIITVTGVRPAVGQPTITESFSVTVTREGVNQILAVNVNLPASVSPTITAYGAPDGAVNIPYTFLFTATGDAPITWSHSGNLPNELTLSAEGLLSGTPTLFGDFKFTVTATNDAGYSSQNIFVNIAPPSTFTVDTAFIDVTEGNLSHTIYFDGTATGAITLNNWTPSLPVGISVTISVIPSTTSTALTFTDNRTAGAAIDYTGTVTLTRQGISAAPPLNVAINLPEIQVPLHTITIVTGGSGASVSPSPAQEGAIVTLNAGTRAGHTFATWTSPNVTINNPTSQTAASFTMPAGNVTVHANWQLTQAALPPPQQQTLPARQTGGGGILLRPRQPVAQQPIAPDASMAPFLPSPPSSGTAVREPGGVRILWTPPTQMSMPPPHQFFTDILHGAWYHNFVGTAVSHGLFAGVGDSNFDPRGSMTRAMFAQVLANLQGLDISEFGGGTRFSDVSPDAWYNAAVEWAAYLGLVSGVGDNLFDPNAPITREQMAVMLHQFILVMGIELDMTDIGATAFTDQASISAWAFEAVALMRATGIVGGRPDGSFDPQATATRAEVATIFAQFLQLI